MKRRRSTLGICGLAAVIATGCIASAPGSPATSSPLGSVTQADFPSDCPPIDLRGPDGERIDLTGEWAGSGVLTSDDEEVALLNQIGECVYGSVSGQDQAGDRAVTNLTGLLQPDLTIDVEIAIVLQEAVFKYGELSRMDMVVEWDDDGRLRLREVREPGERAERCTQPQLECGTPVIWYRTDETP